MFTLLIHIVFHMYVFLFHFIVFFVSFWIGFQFLFTLRGRYLNICCMHNFPRRKCLQDWLDYTHHVRVRGFFSDRVLETPVYLYIYWAASPPNKTSYGEGFIFNSLLTFICQWYWEGEHPISFSLYLLCVYRYMFPWISKIWCLNKFTVRCFSLYIQFLSSNYPNEGITTRPYIEGLVVYTCIYLEKDWMFCLHMEQVFLLPGPFFPVCEKFPPFRLPELQEETELQKVSLVMEKPSNLD